MSNIYGEQQQARVRTTSRDEEVKMKCISMSDANEKSDEFALSASPSPDKLNHDDGPETEGRVQNDSNDKWALLREFLNSTTFHGVKYTVNGRTWARLLWCVLVLVAAGGFLSQAISSITRFASYPTSTSITYKTPDTLEFPAVTICNFNYFVNSSVKNDTVRSALQKVTFTEPLQTLTDDDKTILDSAGGWENLTSDAGVKAEQLIVECYWKVNELLLNCNFENFTKVITPMGNCFTFTSPQMVVTRGGPSGGLNVILDIQLFEYLAEGYGIAGAQVLVHEAGEHPDAIFEEGFACLPGTRTMARIQETRILNLQPRYECKLKMIIEKCRCVPLHMKEWYDKDDTSVCTFQDATCVEIYSWLASNTVNNSKCDCPIPCSQRKFDVQVSQAAFPAPHLDEIIARKFNVSLNYVRQKNLIWLDVFYSYPQLTYIEVKQDIAYSYDNLFGDVGGQFGLFLGASILTFCEFIQYLIFEAHARRLCRHQRHQ
ncbi:acid-sensing ion channel 4-A-like isoform X2 [Corticium candelabrum]|uniref:acid-sensing ion channel 4-A-like isoform X2 n=1 Tax=Corticium candelabrum TaxID=121492 RepID=UPI002E26E4B5|nr:acid-sensing ion channel 4-A-like isoform X2 [Corticium candelabrum]